jgi:hypothetical protein
MHSALTSGFLLPALVLPEKVTAHLPSGAVMAAYEYHTEFTPLTYKTKTAGISLFKRDEPTLDPDVEGYLEDPGRSDRLNDLGQHGWELVAVQPVLRGETKVGNQNAQGWAYGLALPVGYLMFFKRPRNLG